MILRLYLAGRIRIEGPAALVDEDCLPGRQGRLALAMLVCEQAHPLSRDELAEQLWGSQLPAKWEAGLSALISKLRAAFRAAGIDGDTVRSAFGCYQLKLPAGTWIDVEAAEEALHEAEVRLGSEDWTGAYKPAHVALYITQRPLLPGEDSAWATNRQGEWRALWVRALDAAALTCAANGERAVALRHAERAVAIEPLREAGWRRLMSLHAQEGNRASALRAYERCRKALAEELGVNPSPETEARYLELLR